jgi:hypothetical protein
VLQRARARARALHRSTLPHPRTHPRTHPPPSHPPRSTRYALGDVITGRVDFLLVRIKIKHMELAIIRREAAGVPSSGAVVNDSETLTRFEVMDGAPIKGERVPLRLHLAGLDLTPSLAGAANALTVRYFINLVLVDEEDRRYFKQQEITLYRAAISGSTGPVGGSGGGGGVAAGTGAPAAK